MTAARRTTRRKPPKARERRPTLFIGSSTEGLSLAQALQQNLQFGCDATLWSQGVFGLSEGTLESLVEKAGDFDFAALVLSADDVTTSRGKAWASARDNVLLELGIFIGRIGRERTFIVHPRIRELKLPSDLAGVTPTTFENHSDGNLQASLGPAATDIANAVKRLGRRKPEKLNTEIREDTGFQVISDLLSAVARQFFILMLEDGVTLQKQRAFPWQPSIVYEYETLRGSAGNGGFDVDSFCRGLAEAGLLQVDLKDQVSLTKHGKAFARWLVRKGLKVEYFHSDVGGWGVRPDRSKLDDFQRRRKPAGSSVPAQGEEGGPPVPDREQNANLPDAPRSNGITPESGANEAAK